MSKKKGTGSRPPIIAQYNEFDAMTGALLKTVTKRPRPPRFGKGWIMMSKNAQLKLIEMVSPIAITIAMLIAAKQTYTDYVMMSKQWIADKLGVERHTVYRGLKELQEAQWLKIVNIDGNNGFLLNPFATACGQSAVETRRKLWNEEESWERITDSPPSLLTEPSDPTIVEDEDIWKDPVIDYGD